MGMPRTKKIVAASVRRMVRVVSSMMRPLVRGQGSAVNLERRAAAEILDVHDHVLGDPDQEQRPADRRRAVEPPARAVVGAWTDRIEAEVEMNEYEGRVEDDTDEDE